MYFTGGAFLFIAALFIYAGWKGQSIREVMTGTLHPEDHPFPASQAQAGAPPGPSDSAPGGVSSAGYAYPISGKYKVGRTDNGVDFEAAVGAPLHAIGAGTIVNTQGAFPGGSIVLKLDHAIRGHQYVYYGHLADSSKRVRKGQRVAAGTVLAVTSQRPPGAEGMAGHTEIGFARDAGGAIETGGHAPGATGWGSQFAAFIKSIGASAHSVNRTRQGQAVANAKSIFGGP